MKKEPVQRLEEFLTSEHRNLTNEVINEYDLCLILGVGINTLTKLRHQRKLPHLALDSRNRVYLIEDLLKRFKNYPKS